MNTESDEPECYQIYGLTPSEAGLLLEALKSADIVAHTQFIEEPTSVELEGDSGETKVIITVNAESEDAVRRIEADLFGDER